MKNILVPIEEHDFIGSVLETAWRFAQNFEGRIEGIALGPDTGDLIAARGIEIPTINFAPGRKSV
mgnify:CR=1 FL=1